MIKPNFLAAGLFLLVVGGFTSCSKTNRVVTNETYEVVEFPDGSMAYLNHNSSIAYDEGFEPRNVEMEGEVFFSVVHNETPFVVHTQLGDITVLGTEFNVKANEDETEVEVSEGEVELDADGEKSKVRNGQRASYNKEKRKVEMAEARYEFRMWIKSLKIEFKKMGKEIKKGSKVVGKETKKIGKDIDKELKKLKN